MVDTRVDVLTLEDFRSTLDARLSEADSALRALTAETVKARPPLGGFEDATEVADDHERRHNDAEARLRRLISAIGAAKTATDTIISNYSTAEARNRANSTDIENILGSVQTELDGVGNG